jgi:hypothetical protein
MCTDGDAGTKLTGRGPDAGGSFWLRSLHARTSGVN